MFTTKAKLKKGDQLEFGSNGGGGYGLPWERKVESVLEDVIDGLLSIEKARDVYGVAITEIDADALDYEVDEEETEQLREALAEGRPPARHRPRSRSTRSARSCSGPRARHRSCAASSNGRPDGQGDAQPRGPAGAGRPVLERRSPSRRASWCSSPGQVASTPTANVVGKGDVAAQTRQVMENLKLGAGGGGRDLRRRREDRQLHHRRRRATPKMAAVRQRVPERAVPGEHARRGLGA